MIAFKWVIVILTIRKVSCTIYLQVTGTMIQNAEDLVASGPMRGDAEIGAARGGLGYFFRDPIDKHPHDR